MRGGMAVKYFYIPFAGVQDGNARFGFLLQRTKGPLANIASAIASVSEDAKAQSTIPLGAIKISKDDYNKVKEMVEERRAYEREQGRAAPICSSCDRPIEGEVYPGNVCFSCFRRWDP